MKKPYELPLLPITFETQAELALYKKVVDANAKLEKLKEKLGYSIVSQSFLELLTLFESVESTRIEGTQVTFSDMLEDTLDNKDDWQKVEVRNYQEALTAGIEEIKNGYPLSERLIRRLHQILMKNARGSVSSSGHYRRIQNFIGPNQNIKEASYIPPEPQLMDEYMKNLEFFINGHPYEQEPKEEYHPLIKCAIIHAQFESIHPFLDGNGRLGRILIVLYLLQSKLIESPFFFLSEELEKEKFRYYALLNGVRGIGKKKPDWESWILFFLEATIRMADRLYKKLDQAEELFKEGTRKVSRNSTKQVWADLFHFPITTVSQLAAFTGLTQQTIRSSLHELEQHNMVFGDDRKRNRRYYFYDLIGIIQN
ncbi:filamentation induced by cAMP protein Fic [Bacillus sp. OxB-1]|uniref:Fic family protein n=1 Tax=Bacillus sp. (strain OxB-1) TaxID=98228 RepID=UPI000581D6F8|nr:Fic family protein [Bacillus sp. OxB-1]BAQ10005.1 filamentation induced by cAMP protein Fic [Bacillus sp. OxB-1]